MEEENEDRNKKQEKISHQNTTTHTYTNYKPLLYHPEKGLYIPTYYFLF